MRRITLADFPPSLRTGETVGRLHEKGYFSWKFGRRLDAVTTPKLETLTQTFDRQAPEVIRRLIMQATPEDFPQS